MIIYEDHYVTVLLLHSCLVSSYAMVCIDIRLVSKDAHDTYVRITGLPYAMGKMDQILGIKVYLFFFKEVA